MFLEQKLRNIDYLLVYLYVSCFVNILMNISLINVTDFVGATIRLNEANEMKQRIEQSLYCRFLKLLNSKKELICSLNKKLEEKGLIM